MKQISARILNKIGQYLGFGQLINEISAIKKILIESYIDNKVQKDPKNSDTRRLCHFEYQVMSQNGEDGIINEIFNRIGRTNKYFVEFGIGTGIENNTASLLLQGWKGHWIEGNGDLVREITHEYKNLIVSLVLTLDEAFITRENILELFQKARIPNDVDLISIDIDGNDYWIWEKLADYKPRVVVIEYNGSLGPSIEWIMPYNPDHYWNGSIGNFFGASLKSLEKLGCKLGYKLVGCNLNGVNGFFVREDLVNDELFCGPYTSENFFEKPLYFLEKRLGHKRSHKLLGTLKSTV